MLLHITCQSDCYKVYCDKSLDEFGQRIHALWSTKEPTIGKVYEHCNTGVNLDRSSNAFRGLSYSFCICSQGCG